MRRSPDRSRVYLYRDGGPVIGIQLENEYMHVAVPWELTAGQGDELLPAGKDGAEHMLTLKKIAVESGLEVPFYTCTGWGGSPVPEGEMLPIHGGYAFWPWSIDESHPLQEPTGEYLFRDFHGEECREEYPYLCGEIGGGMQC